MADQPDIMGLAEAFESRAELFEHAKTMALIAGDERRPWGERYEAAVTGDHCMDLAKEYDAYIREFRQRA